MKTLVFFVLSFGLVSGSANAQNPKEAELLAKLAVAVATNPNFFDGCKKE
ncbi:MAG: hypothetical protein QG614_520 [Patescibacteria group bacterium]|nr:hypothetical protein [Patescibacteria group bacterium]